MKRNLVKSILTVAMVSAMFIGGSKMEAKAMTVEEFSLFTGIPVEVIVSDPAMVAMYEDVKNEDASIWLGGAEATNPAIAVTAVPVAPTVAGVPVSHPEMLALVNADRAVNGVGALAWSAELEAYCINRLPVAMANIHSPEMAEAKAKGLDTSSIAHRGYTQRENLTCRYASFGTCIAESSNSAWINSTGHHSARIGSGYTQYACASYVDPITGDEVWIEAFGNGAPVTNTSTFDYVRYATDYPDVALVFGQNGTALYNHYITCGKIEGRKAYNTNGTVFK